MGEVDIRAPGAQRRPHAAARRRGRPGRPPAPRTLKDAINEAFRDWVASVDHTALPLRHRGRPAPVPGDGPRLPRGSSATRRARSASSCTGRLPDAVAACVGGGSNAIGIFHAFLDDAASQLYGFEAGGDGVETGGTPRTITARRRRRAARRAHLRAAGRGRARPSSRTRSRRASTTRASAPSTPSSRTPAARPTSRHRRRGDGRASRCSPAPRASSPRSSRAHALAGALQARPRARPGRDRSWSTSPAAATRTWTPRRAGSSLTSTPRPTERGDEPRLSTVDSSTFAKARPTAAPPSSATCPPGSPTSRAAIAALRAMVEARLRRDRGRPALLRPADGRPDDPGRRPRGARRAAPASPTCCAPSRPSPRPAPPTLVMTYWNPIDRYGVDRFAARPGERRGRGPDHARPHPRGGRPWLEAQPTRTGSTRSSWSRPAPPTSASMTVVGAARGFVYAASLMGVTGARDRGRRGRRGLVERTRAAHRPAGRASASASAPAPGRRGRGLRRRCHRRARRSSAASWTPPTRPPASPRCASWAPSWRRASER